MGKEPDLGRWPYSTLKRAFAMTLLKLGENVFYARKEVKVHKGGSPDVGNKNAGKSRIKFQKYDLPQDADIKLSGRLDHVWRVL